MVKIKVLNRSVEEHQPSTSNSTAPISRNLDPALHPFARPREYQRAVTAAKLDRMFAKPFVASLEGHADGIYCLAKDESGGLSRVASGSGDGEIRVWDLADQRTVWHASSAHRGAVRGIAFAPAVEGEEGRAEDAPGTAARRAKRRRRRADTANDSDDDYTPPTAGSPRVLTCGADKTVKLWDVKGDASKPLQIYSGKAGFNAVSHHRFDPVFATASNVIDIWDETKTAPISTLRFNASSAYTTGEHIVSVTFNKSETSVLASSGSDRSVVLYDLRSGKALHRVAMQMRVNQLVFNPLQPPVLLCASEDHNLYTFDIRNLSTTTQVYKGHVGAALGCDWSPTGREFVSGSYDRTVRLWTAGDGHARDTYHTKRMQRVFATQYTLDARFVLSGSDDGNLRVWKARASEKLGVVDKREQARTEYRASLRQKWGNVAEVERLERQRYLPKPIHNAQKLQATMRDARRTKEEHRLAHAPKTLSEDQKKPKPERKVAIERVES